MFAATTGLTVGALYIYAAMVSGAMVLEASATAHAVDSRNGQRVKAGDQTRALVGMARPAAGPLWQYTAALPMVRTYYNDPGTTFQSVDATNSSTASTTPVNLGGVSCGFLAWANEVVNYGLHGTGYNSGAAHCHIGIGVDTNTAYSVQQQALYSAIGGAVESFGGLVARNFSEGFHALYVMGHASTGTFTVGGTPNIVTVIEGACAGIAHSTGFGGATSTAQPLGQCVLTMASTSIVRLLPYKGNLLTINGAAQAVPAAGVDLADRTDGGHALLHLRLDERGRDDAGGVGYSVHAQRGRRHRD